MEPTESPNRTALIDAMQANYIAYFRQFLSLPGMVMQDDPELTWFVAPTAPGQHVLRTRLTAGDARTRIAATIRRLEQLTDRFRWLVFATATPPDLDRLLLEAGLVEASGDPWMAASLLQLPPTPITPDGFHVKRVYDHATLDDWMVVSAAGYGMSMHMARIWYDAYAAQGFSPDAPSQHFVGYLDDQPATVGTLLLSPGMAGIFDVATPTRFRRQGFAAALTHAAMTMAQERGFHRACLQASSQGVGLYGTLGFTTIFTEREFIWRRA